MSRVKQLFGERQIPTPTTRNAAGYPAYERSLEEQYLQTLLTNRCDNTFYSTSKDQFDSASKIHDQMIAKDPAFVAGALQFARKEGFMRMQPIYGLAKLSGKHPELFSKAYHGVVNIPDDAFELLTIINSMGRGEGGRAIKRMNGQLANKTSEYWAIKYNGRGRGYSLADLIKTCHPKPASPTQNAIFAYLVGKPYDEKLVPQIAAYEALKKATNEDEIIRLIGAGRLPLEVVTGAVSKMTPKIWNAMVPQMPMFALLRNINALQRAGVLDSNRKYIETRFNDAEALKKARILPFRFLTAMEAVNGSGWIYDVFRGAIEHTFASLPEFPGRTNIQLDISGSMSGQNLLIGGIFGFAMYKKTDGDSSFWLFDTSIYDAKPSKHDTILSQAQRLRTQGATDTGCGVAKLIQDKTKVDNIIIITDEQQNTGSPFYRRLTDYRSKVNPNCQAFIVDLVSTAGSMVPPTDKQTHYIYGWSDTVLKYISWSLNGWGGMVDAVKRDYMPK